MTASHRARFTAMVLTGLVLGSSCSAEQDVVAEPGDLRHVHDFALDEDGTLLAASHTGLYRIEGPERAILVGTERHDLMAMTTDSDGDLLASGHPDLRLSEYRVEGREPHLGLIESSDLGRSWESTALLGEADFHALATTTDGIYAAESTGGALWFRSKRDGEWERRGSADLHDLALDPTNSTRLIGADESGALLLTEDGGSTWTTIADAPAVTELEWTKAAGIHGVDEEGMIWRTADTDDEWAIVGAGPGEPETFWIATDGTWWLSVHGGDIWRSDDGGADWQQVYRSMR